MPDGPLMQLFNVQKSKTSLWSLLTVTPRFLKLSQSSAAIMIILTFPGNAHQTKKTTCQDISSNWECLKLFLVESNNGDVTVSFNCFQKTNIITKKGKETKRLKLLKTDADMVFLVNFVDNILAKSIYHRNMLKYYRNTRSIFESLFDSVSIHIDFAENFTVPVKYEPQLLHWSHEQVTVHSGIMKVKGEKTYHLYFSDSLKHDQVFVKKVPEEM